MREPVELQSAELYAVEVVDVVAAGVPEAVAQVWVELPVADTAVLGGLAGTDCVAR